MATDALAGYRADVAAGKEALLVCDINEMSDALNQRLRQAVRIVADQRATDRARDASRSRSVDEGLER